MVLLLGHSEDGRGQWEREGSSVVLGCGMSAFQKNPRGAKAVVYDPTLYHRCFSESWIRMLASVFWGNPAEILPD